jgi:hypothetical protein
MPQKESGHVTKLTQTGVHFVSLESSCYLGKSNITLTSLASQVTKVSTAVNSTKQDVTQLQTAAAASEEIRN